MLHVARAESVTRAGEAQGYAEGLGVDEVSMHPDWALWTEALFVIVVQPSFPLQKWWETPHRAQLMNCGLARLAAGSDPAAQQTAAALLCGFHLTHIGICSKQSERHQLFSQALSQGDLDAVLRVLRRSLKVKSQHF